MADEEGDLGNGRSEVVPGAGVRHGSAGTISDIDVLTKLRSLLRAVPDVSLADLEPVPASEVKCEHLAKAIEAHWRFGQPPFSIAVEIAPGVSIGGFDPDSILEPRFKALVADRVARLRADSPKTRIPKQPKILWPGALLLRAQVAPQREAILRAHAEHRAILHRLVAQHRADGGWRERYDVPWRPGGECAGAGTLKGARDLNHLCTTQASIVGSYLKDETTGPGGERLDGLEAALLCDYCCAGCKGEALGMIDAIFANVTAGDRRTGAGRKPPRISRDTIKHRILFEAEARFPKPVDVNADSLSATWRNSGFHAAGHKIAEARARLRESELLGDDDVLTDAGREVCRKLGGLPEYPAPMDRLAAKAAPSSPALGRKRATRSAKQKR